MPPSKKGAKFDLSDLLKWPLWWFNQINIYTVHGYLPNEAIHLKRKKVIRQFWRNSYFKWKVDDGRRRTTDESALEKLRCLSAGGAKNSKFYKNEKKMSSYMHPRNIPTDFPKNPKIGCWVADVDRQTDRPTDRRHPTAIGTVDLKISDMVF